MKHQKIVLALFIFISGCVTQSNTARNLIYLSQNVQEQDCSISEIGNFGKSDAVKFRGKLREIDPQVYECAVEIPMPEFQKIFGYCVIRGHNIAAGYEFFRGASNSRRHSCDARPLRNGNFYFKATGINNDSCDWLCFPPIE
jgi:hypothetical protein